MCEKDGGFAELCRVKLENAPPKIKKVIIYCKKRSLIPVVIRKPLKSPCFKGVHSIIKKFTFAVIMYK